MPHVMFGGLIHEPALTLARRLAALLGPGLDRVFYTDSGSVAVEVAMKMALQYWLNQGERGRGRFLAFKGGYHGDTFGTMAVCDPEEGMHSLFRGMLAEHDIVALPRDEAGEAELDAFLARRGPQLAGILVEPLVQGAGGMLMHDPEVLRRLRRLADRHGLLLIYDEIFTGFGRTGTMFAYEQAGARPDIITLSKALTGGTLPLAATVASSRVFDAFWSDDPSHALMHGPTFMGNALACAAANASLDLFEREPRSWIRRGRSAPRWSKGWRRAASCPGCATCACWARSARWSWTASPIAKRSSGGWSKPASAWPFGNVVYLTPALTIAADELAVLTGAVSDVLRRQRP